MANRLKTVFQAGAQAGLKANVFFKAGDSITAGSAFMEQFKYPAYVAGTTKDWDFAYNLGTYTNLQGARDYFMTGVIGANNPYDRVSSAAKVGEATEWALAGAPSPLEAEISTTAGAFGVVMFGTNDIGAPQTDSYVYR